VPILPDDQFERYLKQFRPLGPEQLQLEERRRKNWRPRYIAAWASVAAAVIVAFLTLYPRVRQGTERDVQPSSATQIVVPQPLTIRSADALLADAPSFKAAVDALALSSHATSFGVKQSALKVLSKDSKL
jgi:hypothetical protein